MAPLVRHLEPRQVGALLAQEADFDQGRPDFERALELVDDVVDQIDELLLEEVGIEAEERARQSGREGLEGFAVSASSAPRSWLVGVSRTGSPSTSWNAVRMSKDFFV